MIQPSYKLPHVHLLAWVGNKKVQKSNPGFLELGQTDSHITVPVDQPNLVATFAVEQNMFISHESVFARLKPKLTCQPRSCSRSSSVSCRHLASSKVKSYICCSATSPTELGLGHQWIGIRLCSHPSGQRAPLRNFGWERLARSF